MFGWGGGGEEGVWWGEGIEETVTETIVEVWEWMFMIWELLPWWWWLVVVVWGWDWMMRGECKKKKLFDPSHASRSSPLYVPYQDPLLSLLLPSPSSIWIPQNQHQKNLKTERQTRGGLCRQAPSQPGGVIITWNPSHFFIHYFNNQERYAMYDVFNSFSPFLKEYGGKKGRGGEIGKEGGGAEGRVWEIMKEGERDVILRHLEEQAQIPKIYEISHYLTTHIHKLTKKSPTSLEIMPLMTKTTLQTFFYSIFDEIVFDFDSFPENIEKNDSSCHKNEKNNQHSSIPIICETLSQSSPKEDGKNEKWGEFVKNYLLFYHNFIKEWTNDEQAPIISVDLCCFNHTSASFLSFALHMCAEYPDVQERLFQEIRNCVGSNCEPNIHEIDSLKYFDCFLKEINRMFPSKPYLSCVTKKITNLGGYEIDQDSIVLFSIYTMHRHPKLWERPNDFRPDRFLDKISGKKPLWESLKGNYFILQTKIILISLLKNFKFSKKEGGGGREGRGEGVRVGMGVGGGLRPEVGEVVVVEKREGG